MSTNEHMRRDVLQALATLPLMALVARSSEAAAQTGGSPVKVDTKGLVAKIKFEAPIGGFLNEINGKYKLRVTELTLAPGGHVGEHNHVGPGIRQVTSGYMTYVLPKETIVYGPGDFFFETGDINQYRLQQDGRTNGARIVRDTACGPQRTVPDSSQASLAEGTSGGSTAAIGGRKNSLKTYPCWPRSRWAESSAWKCAK
jgi:quercetin dioxygenase-like cupin family protein